MSRGYTGTIAGVEFDDGSPDRDINAAVRAYASRHGLRVDGDRLVVVESDDEPRVDSRDVTEQKVGTPLRDAAVDPKPGDFLPPINAGQADPHGPEVIAPHVHGAADRRITPGPVHVDNPAAQEISETAATVEQHDLGEPERPAKSARKAEWEAYATARGFLDDPSELTKEDLIERFGED
jgi:hypothetical protein